MNFLLVIVARVLLWIFSFPLFVFGLCASEDKRKYNRQLALTLDVLGNVIGGPFWNFIFIKDKSAQIVKFGSRLDTISFVLAMNRHNLTRAGKLITRILEKLDKGHLDDAIQNP